MTTQNMAICILGRLPGLSIAELESLYGSDSIEKLSNNAALVRIPSEQIDFSRLGGTVKLTKLLHVFERSDWDLISDYLVKTVPEHINNQTKLTLGLSTYGLDVSPKKLLATGLTVKKGLRKIGVSTRITPNNEPALSSAQVFHNKLTQDNAWELCFIRSGNKVYMSKTIKVQDIDAYTARDQKRPKRDARVGMLPPKLAQTIINLAVGSKPQGTDQIILDPFCGTGVILQEAVLMNYSIIGSDISNMMTDFSQKNLMWLTKKSKLPWPITVADATNFTWWNPGSFDFIASETYLGRPFSKQPDSADLQKVMQDVDTILSKFLNNVARQTRSGFRLCIAVPAWKNGSTFKHLPMLEKLSQLGYTRVSFKHATDSELIYYRDDQMVARELLVLVRK